MTDLLYTVTAIAVQGDPPTTPMWPTLSNNDGSSYAQNTPNWNTFYQLQTGSFSVVPSSIIANPGFNPPPQADQFRWPDGTVRDTPYAPAVPPNGDQFSVAQNVKALIGPDGTHGPWEWPDGSWRNVPPYDTGSQNFGSQESLYDGTGPLYQNVGAGAPDPNPTENAGTYTGSPKVFAPAVGFALNPNNSPYGS